MSPTNQTQASLRLTPETMAALVADRCYRDQDFRQRFLQDPKQAFMDDFILSTQKQPQAKQQRAQPSPAAEELPVEIISHRNTSDTWHIVLPTKDGNGELHPDDLDKMSSGVILVASTLTYLIAASFVGLGITAAVIGATAGTIVARSAT